MTQDTLTLEELQTQIKELKEKVSHYQTKQLRINNELLYCKVNGQSPEQTIDNLIQLITQTTN
jgi:hypothetical protein